MKIKSEVSSNITVYIDGVAPQIRTLNILMQTQNTYNEEEVQIEKR